MPSYIAKMAKPSIRELAEAPVWRMAPGVADDDAVRA
jgi:hypothetical protein